MDHNTPGAAAGRRLRRPVSDRRRLMAARLWRAATGQTAEVEARLKARRLGLGDAAETERDAKTLAILARASRDIAALDHDAVRARPEPEPADAIDADHFRLDLARRLEALGRGG